MQYWLKRKITDSLVMFADTHALAVCAMLLAVQVLLGFVTTISIGSTLRISFGFLPIATVAHLFGPIPAMINGALCDLINFGLRPTGPYHAGFTLTAAITGFIYGMVFYRTRVTPLRIVAAKLVVDLFAHILLNTLWIHQLYGNAFLPLMFTRAYKNMLQLPIDVALLLLLFRSLSRASAVLKRYTPDVAPKTPFLKRRILAALFVVLWVVVGVWLNNTSLFVDTQGKAPNLLAHRGLGQTFDIKGLKWDTDTSKIIHTPEHPYLENTVDSMRHAFDLGAKCIELDVRRTKDNALAVFHDDVLDYRTNAQGRVSDYTMDELRALDIGYGYTADDGQTFPFRGKGIGLMPEFREVLSAVPYAELLVHLKDGDEQTASLVWDAVKDLVPNRIELLAFYGDESSMAYLRTQYPSLRLMSLNALKNNLIQYQLFGWTGFVPDTMKNTQLHIPESYARFIWGWPARFMQRMDDANTRVILVAGNGEWAEGFDTLDDFARIPTNYTGYIWTNRIDNLKGVQQ